MNFRILVENDLASFVENLVGQLTGPDLVSLDAAIKADLIAAIGTLPVMLRTKADAADVIEGQRMAAVSERNEVRSTLHTIIGQMKNALRAGLASKKEYDLCKLDYPGTVRTRYIAQDPTELSVKGFSNGVNLGVFSGNNKSHSVVYDIWRREGDDGPWAAHMMTKKQRFEDTGVTPGQYYEYRVRAIASTSTSQFSNSAVVYGVL